MPVITVISFVPSPSGTMMVSVSGVNPVMQVIDSV
jgi:hypothetical protein